MCHKPFLTTYFTPFVSLIRRCYCHLIIVMDDPGLYELVQAKICYWSTLKERKMLPAQDIVLLLEFCLKNIYFSFQGQYYEQIEGVAMGSPVSPIVANFYMEYLEQKALSIAIHPTKILLRYVDDTWVVQREENNKTSFNTLTVLTQPLSLQWKTTRRMGPSPSWTPLSSQRLMVSYLSLYIESPPTQTSIYSGIATINSHLSTV